MSFLEELLLNLQVVVIAGLSIVSGPQLLDDQVTQEAFTDFCVFTITLLVASRKLFFAASEQVVGDLMASASLLGLVIWSASACSKVGFISIANPVRRRIWNTDILSSSALSVS